MDTTGRHIIRAVIPLLVYFGISCAVAVVVSWVFLALGKDPETMDSAALTVLTSVCGIPVLGWMWKQDRIRFPGIFARKKNAAWVYPAAFLAGAAASWLISSIMDWSGIRTLFSNQVQEELFAATLPLQIVGLGLLVPVAEELLYRGLLYGRLREFLPVTGAVLTASLIFALSHGNMLQFLYALPMGLLLQALCQKTGTLAMPILFHMGANLLSVAVTALKI